MMAPHHLQTLLEIVRSCLSESSGMSFIHHALTFSALDKQALFPPHWFVQKTLTVAVQKQVFLVSGLRDFRLSREHLRALATALALPKQQQAFTINPRWAPASQVSGLALGMVSPFIPPGHIADPPITAVVLLPAPVSPSAQTAISLSLEHSLLVPAASLNTIVETYAGAIYPQIPVWHFSHIQQGIPAVLGHAEQEKERLYVSSSPTGIASAHARVRLDQRALCDV
jgi:hypothetical protein